TAIPHAVGQGFFRLTVTVAALTGFQAVNPAIVTAGAGDYDINEVTFDLLLKVPLPALLIGLFALVVWAMVPFGQLVAAYFDRLPRIPAYSVNVAGSLLGVLAFSAFAWLELPPTAWFAAGAALLWVLDRHVRHLAAALMMVGVIVGQAIYDSGGGRFL